MDVRSAHLQHPQPAIFHASARDSSRSHRLRAPRRAPHQQIVSPAPRSERSRRHLVSVVTRRGRHDISPSRRHIHPGRRRGTASDPVPVISIIRPTSDKPQLPSVQQAATQSIILPTLYNDRGRLIVPTPLFGSHEILVRQNTLADQDGLGRVQDEGDLSAMRSRGMLLPIPVSEALRVDTRLPSNRRYCRAWTARFLDTLARDHYARFHTPLQVNSAVRTVDFQLRLLRTNGNAAPAEGDTASPHLTGQAIDIAKRGLSLTEIAWLRGYLLPLIQEGRVDVEEEFQQSCFHISVYRRYLPPDTAPPRYNVSSRTPPALAVAIP